MFNKSAMYLYFNIISSILNKYNLLQLWGTIMKCYNPFENLVFKIMYLRLFPKTQTVFHAI